MKHFIYLVTLFWLLANNSKAAYNVNITHFTEDNGLPQSVISAVMQDSKGYIWIASWNGLARYDGYSFLHYKTNYEDHCQLAGNRILYIRETKGGNILCKCPDGFYLFKTAEKKFLKITNKKTDSGDRFRPTNEQKAMVNSLPEYKNIENKILYKDKQGGYWIYTHNGLDRLTFNKEKAYPIKHNSNGEEFVRAIYKYNDKQTIIADKNGYVIITNAFGKANGYIAGDGSITKNRTKFGANVYSVLKDSHGYLWLGSKPSGLFRLEDSGKGGFIVKSFMMNSRNKYGINCNSIYSIIEDKHGRILLGTYGGGLNIIINPWGNEPKFLNSNNIIRYPTEGLFIRDMLLTKNGTLLMATKEGIFTTSNNWKPRQMKFYQNKRSPNDASSLSTNQTMGVIQGRNGTIYVATYGGGMNIITSKDLLSNKIRFKALTMNNGMASDVILNVFEDNNGKIWLISEHCLMTYEPEKNSFTNYTRSMFGGNFSFSEVRPIYNKADGIMLFGTTQGVIPIKEKTFGKSSFVPKIVFDADKYIELSPDEKNITISFSALDYNRNEPIQYSYKLEGIDKEWLYTRENSINLSNIPAGTFRLIIKSTNGDGVWVDNETYITIHRTPYFNERPIAWMLYGAIIIVVVFGIFIFIRYTRRLEKEIKQLRLSKDEKMEYIKMRIGDMMDSENRINNSDAIESSEFKTNVETFMKQNLSDPELNVANFAQKIGVSRSVLYIQMKKEFGCTPNSYILDYRLNAAYNMLINEKGLNVSEIAYRCGFSDPKYFSRCFKKTKGCTPSEVRE